MSLTEEIRLLHAELAAARKADVQALASKLIESDFSCTRCSKCCRGAFGDNTVAVFPREVRAIMAASGKSWFEVVEPPEGEDYDDRGNLHVFEWVLRRMPDGDCVFLKDGLCTVYEARPHICRTYPFRLDSAAIESYDCEGAGRCPTCSSELVSLAEALIARRIGELEESIALLERFEPFGQGERSDSQYIVVHDSEGTKYVRRSADGHYSFCPGPGAGSG
ncbi:YkgJ family cysteine cluster protein [Methanocella sp. MCL-LM]|uniref:YkgJ family cysteine cluster protein n=1 Tax=Methanocella sp. MCL-LM TaxID=3412035 RepID=UPI003C780DD7